MVATIADAMIKSNAAINALAVNKEKMDISIIGSQIAKGRKDKGLSQASFAELLNVTPQCVGKWERSESLPDILTLAKIGEIIGTCEIGYFLGKSCNCGCHDKTK